LVVVAIVSRYNRITNSSTSTSDKKIR